MDSTEFPGPGKVSAFIMWSYPGDRPTEVEYEITGVGRDSYTVRTLLHEAVEVETPSRIRHRFLWNGVAGPWSDEGIPWQRRSR
jgi:hypothetical protein